MHAARLCERSKRPSAHRAAHAARLCERSKRPSARSAAYSAKPSCAALTNPNTAGLDDSTRPTNPRTIQTAFVLALHHGGAFQTASVAAAIGFVQNYDESTAVNAVYRHEVNVRYTNVDEVRATFAARD